MDFLRRKHGGEPVRFDFTVHVKELGPWPSGKKSIAIGWQRGSKRKGSTRSQEPVKKSGALFSTYNFDEAFQVPATLYRENMADSNAPGKFRKKCLVLAILETDGRAKATGILGRVVINLAEYAGYDVEEFLHFPVTCNRAISAAVGQPLLRIDLVCRWKKKQPSKHREGSIGGASSISTDTSNSTLSSHLSSFKPARASSMMSANSGASPKDHVRRQLADLEGFEDVVGAAVEDGGGASSSHLTGRSRPPGLPPTHQASGGGQGGSEPVHQAREAADTAGSRPERGRTSQVSASSNPNTLESIAEGDGDGSSPQAVATPMEILTRGKSKLDKVSRWLDEQPESSGLEEQDGEQPLGLSHGPGEPRVAGTGEQALRAQAGTASGSQSFSSAQVEAPESPFASDASGQAPGRRTFGNPSGDMAEASREEDASNPFASSPLGEDTRAAVNPFVSPPENATKLNGKPGPYEGKPGADGGTNPFESPPGGADVGAVSGSNNPFDEKDGQVSVVSGQSSQNAAAVNPFAAVSRASVHRRSDSTPADPAHKLNNPYAGAREMDRSSRHSEGQASVRPTTEAVPVASSVSARGTDHQQSNGQFGTADLTGPIIEALGWKNAMAEATVRLQMLAAMEASVYFARRQGNSGLRRRMQRSHSPARRLARTIKALGPVTGRAFGRHAIQGIRGIAEGSGEDVGGLIFWWCNCVALRVMLTSDRLVAGANFEQKDWEHTVTDLCVAVAALERHLYERTLQSVWWRLFVPAVASSDAHARSANARTGGNGKSEDDSSALSRWQEALETMRATLCPLSLAQVGGHAKLLASQVLCVCLRRMDLMLFTALVSGGVDEPLPEVFADLGDGALSEVSYLFPNLDEGVLPFSKRLTFSTGMRVKMALSKWEAWASDAGVSAANAPTTDIFPLLRSVADLLMLPKVRIPSVLSLSHILKI